MISEQEDFDNVRKSQKNVAVYLQKTILAKRDETIRYCCTNHGQKKKVYVYLFF